MKASVQPKPAKPPLRVSGNQKKAPSPIDIHVGLRVRSARLALGITQERLAKAIGLTFQQVQKYEKGTNRIGSSRMVQIAAALHKPVAWFFEGAGNGSSIQPADDLAARFFALPLAREVAIEFAMLGIEDRRLLVEVVRRMAAR